MNVRQMWRATNYHMMQQHSNDKQISADIAIGNFCLSINHAKVTFVLDLQNLTGPAVGM